MIKFENTEVMGWKAAIRGMRNPMNSWEKGDSLFIRNIFCDDSDDMKLADLCGGIAPIVGDNDLDLMKRLQNAGPGHRKFMPIITVYVDITAPLYWWKEADTYKVGTVANSCSTMHKIHTKEFTVEDFSCEHMYQETYDLFKLTIDHLNRIRNIYLHGGTLRVGEATAWFEAKGKQIWWNMIQLLPSSYNQKRTLMMNYEVLANIYKSRRNHKLDEWAEHNKKTDNEILQYFGFCDWIKTLPYCELITGEELLSE